jgi:meiotically up-regulated gene 157 (Mug157) protein
MVPWHVLLLPYAGARGRRWRSFSSQHTSAVLSHLTAAEIKALRALCGRCLYHTLNHDLAVHGNAKEHVFVATGDIDAQWLRDSAVQLAIYLPRIAAHPIIRPVSCSGW